MAKLPPPRMMRYVSAGFELMIIFALWLLFGWWLDGKFNTSPALLLAGAVVGFGLGMYRMIRDAQRAFRDARPREKDDDVAGRSGQ